jgi:hypothetical protein
MRGFGGQRFCGEGDCAHDALSAFCEAAAQQFSCLLEVTFILSAIGMASKALAILMKYSPLIWIGFSYAGGGGLLACGCRCGLGNCCEGDVSERSSDKVYACFGGLCNPNRTFIFGEIISID